MKKCLCQKSQEQKPVNTKIDAQKSELPRPANKEEKQDIAVKNTEKTVNNVISNVSLNDLDQNWKNLLEKMKKENPPSEARFANGRAMEISPTNIVIAFDNEMFLKLAQEKIIFLEKTAHKLFNTTPIVRLIFSALPVEKPKEKPKSPIRAVEKQEIKPANEISEQISQDFDEIQKPFSVDASKEQTESIDDEIIEQIENINMSPTELSGQAKMVFDLFKGKIID